MGSSLPSNAISYIGEYFNVTSQIQLALPISCYLMGYVVGPLLCAPTSEHYGRKPIIVGTLVGYTLFTMACAVAPNWPSLLFFRFICGIFAAAPMSVVGGMYADIYNEPRARGMVMSYYMAITAGGPLIAPAISGFIAENTTWRWVFGVATILAAVTLPLIFCMPETYLPILLSQRAAKLRKETGENVIAKTDLQKKSFKFVLTVVMTRPFRMLFQELIVMCVCAYLSLAYAIFYLYFEAYPLVFQGPDSVYKWSPGIAGLAFLPIGLGVMVSGPIFYWWDARLIRARKQNAAWVRKEEYRRLPLACVGGPLYVISLLWLGWTARQSVHWIVPTLSGITFGIGFLLIFMALLNYLVDAYETFAASAQGIASTCRSIFGALLPLAAQPMFRKLGIAWACSLLAFLSLGMAVIPFAFIKYGDTIRANSKFCQELKALKKRDEEDLEKERAARRASVEVTLETPELKV